MKYYLIYKFYFTRRGGEIGRRRGLKIPRASARESSILSPGILIMGILHNC